MTGYRGFKSKAAYEAYYGGPLEKWELDAMAAYVKEADEENKMNTQANIPTLRDVTAKKDVEIQIRQDGLVVWVNVDGICVTRIMTNGFVPIEVEDNRK